MRLLCRRSSGCCLNIKVKKKTMGNLVYYLALVAAIVIGVILIKRFVSCLFRTIVTLVLVAIFAYIYYYYLRG